MASKPKVKVNKLTQPEKALDKAQMQAVVGGYTENPAARKRKVVRRRLGPPIELGPQEEPPATDD